VPKQMTIDGDPVPMPAQVVISPRVLRPGYSGFWRAVLVRMSPTTTRVVGYVYVGEF